MSTLLNLIKSKTRGEWIIPADSIFITSNSKLIIGPYNALKEYSTGLRTNRHQQSLLSNLEARFGRRGSDSIPLGAIVKGGFRSKIKGRQLLPAQLEALMHQHARERYDFNRVAGFKPRKTDEYAEAASYFNSITLESHHIVENALLSSMNMARGDLREAAAPCVLVTGELHRRFFTPVGSKFRNPGADKEAMINFYADMYSCPDFQDLRIAMQAIADTAFSM